VCEEIDRFRCDTRSILVVARFAELLGCFLELIPGRPEARQKRQRQGGRRRGLAYLLLGSLYLGLNLIARAAGTRN
jgi:hypothetical protein